MLCLAIQSVVLRPAAIASPGNLLEMLTLRLQCRSAESESLRGERGGRGHEGAFGDDRNVYLDSGVIHLDAHIFVHLLRLFNSYMCILPSIKYTTMKTNSKKHFLVS